MACHALYGVSSKFGGNTWDFEAWRDDVDWAEALSVNGRCGQGYGDQPAAAEFLQGTLVKAFDTHASTLAAQTWLVSNLNGVNVLRNVASPRGYACLLAKGKAVARWMPSSFLDEYLAGRAPDVFDNEACGTSGGSSGSGTSTPIATAPPGPTGTGPTPTPIPTPPPTYFVYHVENTCLDGACGLHVREGPGYSAYASLGVLSDGTDVQIVCQAEGETVGPSPSSGVSSSIWDNLTSGGWVSDLYIDTPGFGTWTPSIPRC
jgi:hypothetical protein